MKVIAATGNMGKLREFARIFAPLGIEPAAQSEVCPGLSVEETGTTFAENAFLKADAVHERTGLAAVADDSGLCVDALDGAPGVYSARYAGEETPYPEKISRLLGELEGVPEERRTARFVAHICYIGADGARIDAASGTTPSSTWGTAASRSSPLRRRTRYPTAARRCGNWRAS